MHYFVYNLDLNDGIICRSCSGVALKVNAKLANVVNNPRSWKIEGNQWINEDATLVIGYSMASGKFLLHSF